MKLYNIQTESYERKFGRYDYFLIGDKEGHYDSCHCDFDKVDESNNYFYDNTIKGYPKIIKTENDQPGWIAFISSKGDSTKISKEQNYENGEIYVTKEGADVIEVASYGYKYVGKPNIKDARYYEYLVIIYDTRRPVYLKVHPVGKPNYWLIFFPSNVDKLKEKYLADYTWNSITGKTEKKLINLCDLHYQYNLKFEGMPLEEIKSDNDFENYKNLDYIKTWQDFMEGESEGVK